MTGTVSQFLFFRSVFTSGRSDPAGLPQDSWRGRSPLHRDSFPSLHLCSYKPQMQHKNLSYLCLRNRRRQSARQEKEYPLQSLRKSKTRGLGSARAQSCEWLPKSSPSPSKRRSAAACPGTGRAARCQSLRRRIVSGGFCVLRSNRMAPATELVMNEPNKKFLELRSNSRGHGGISFKKSLRAGDFPLTKGFRPKETL